MRQLCSTALLMFVLLATTMPSAQPVAAAPSAAPFNPRLAINVGSNGKFNLGAFPDPQTGGALPGTSWDLSYQWPDDPYSSFTTIRINDADTVYGESGTQLQAPTISGGVNTSAWRIGNTEVTQQLSIVLNPQTGQQDVARIAYTVRNVGTSAQTVGTRVVIDTELNYNDGAPFRVPGDGIKRNEREYLGSDVPDSFQVFFGLDDSTHVAASTLRGGDATPPDRLILANWRRLGRAKENNIYYDYTVDTSVSFSDPGSSTSSPENDSAYAVYWTPQTLAPSQSRTYVTYYGLSELNIDLQPPLALGVSGPATLTVDGTGYTPNPFDVTATVFNNGTAPAAGVQLTLNLTGTVGLTLVGSAQTQTVGDLAVGQEEQVTWRVRAAVQPSEKRQDQQKIIPYAVVASATNTAAKTVTRTISLPPTSTSSFYVTSDQISPNVARGCDARRRGEQGRVVMIFGSPRLLAGGKQGTQLRAGSRVEVSVDTIRDIVLAFARGYMGIDCSPANSSWPREPLLQVIVATTNSYRLLPDRQDNPALTPAHGAAWAQMINDINVTLKRNYNFAVVAFGGYDAEPSWSSHPPTLAWTQGYSTTASFPYFNVGSCDGCLRTEPYSTWNDETSVGGKPSNADKLLVVKHVYQLSKENPWARAMPQMYHAPYAYEWYNVKRYAADQGNTMFIGGVMSSCTTTTCIIDDTSPWEQKGQLEWLSPLQAWQALHDLLTAPTTPEQPNNGQPNPIQQQNLPYITDFINGANA